MPPSPCFSCLLLYDKWANITAGASQPLLTRQKETALTACHLSIIVSLRFIKSEQQAISAIGPGNGLSAIFGTLVLVSQVAMIWVTDKFAICIKRQKWAACKCPKTQLAISCYCLSPTTKIKRQRTKGTQKVSLNEEGLSIDRLCALY